MVDGGAALLFTKANLVERCSAFERAEEEEAPRVVNEGAGWLLVVVLLVVVLVVLLVVLLAAAAAVVVVALVLAVGPVSGGAAPNENGDDLFDTML